MMKPMFLALLLTFSIAPAAFAASKGDEPYESSLARSAAEPTPGEILAFAITLLGFLGLIATNLVRWSSDLSWKERSVFSPEPREGSGRSSRSAP